MSEIETMVLGTLSKHRELEPIDQGYRMLEGEDESVISFTPAKNDDPEFPVVATARVATRFRKMGTTIPDFLLARLNQRSVFGSFDFEDGQLTLTASYCIYANEPAAQWVAVALLRAFGEQLAVGVALIQSTIMPETLEGNRANLEYPFTWSVPPYPASLEQFAAIFSSKGFVANADVSTLVMEVPMDGGSRSRMINRSAATALLQVRLNVQHPLVGVGYLGTIMLPEVPSAKDAASWCKALNAAEHRMIDFVPRLGAWATRGLDGQVVYSVFWPTDQAAVDLPGTMMNWLLQRAVWLREQFWALEDGPSSTRRR